VAVELTERPVQLRGSRLARTLLRLAGWRLMFDGLPARQGVAIVYPHTSNWDFVVGVLAKWAIGIPVVFWGKATLFELPLLGRWLRWLGGLPVDRRQPGGAVREMVRRMHAARARGDFLWLALAPEGTRAAAPGWRSGFHRVAVDAGVPLALVQLDFARRAVGIHACLRLSGDGDADLAEIARRSVGVQGYRPQLASPIRWLSRP
jgi:1-acyl-sn-glycerol-3-phosphate acyltransferase